MEPSVASSEVSVREWTLIMLDTWSGCDRRLWTSTTGLLMAGVQSLKLIHM